MSKAYISLALRKQVREHFSYRCAYCLSPEWIIGTAFTVDHIIPERVWGRNNSTKSMLGLLSLQFD